MNASSGLILFEDEYTSTEAEEAEESGILVKIVKLFELRDSSFLRNMLRSSIKSNLLSAIYGSTFYCSVKLKFTPST